MSEEIKELREDLDMVDAEMREWKRQALEALAENKKWEKSFELYHSASMRGINLWKEATGNDLIWPDKGELTKWLLDRLDASEAEIAKLKQANERMAGALGSPWRKSSECPPPEYQKVVAVWLPDGEPHVVTQDSTAWRDETGSINECTDPDYWMPIPDLSKESDDA